MVQIPSNWQELSSKIHELKSGDVTGVQIWHTTVAQSSIKHTHTSCTCNPTTGTLNAPWSGHTSPACSLLFFQLFTDTNKPKHCPTRSLFSRLACEKPAVRLPAGSLMLTLGLNLLLWGHFTVDEQATQQHPPCNTGRQADRQDKTATLATLT